MAKKVINRDEQNRKKILNAVVQATDKSSEFKAEGLSAEKIAENIATQTDVLKKVSDTLKLSSVKGKGGVLASINVYSDLLNRLKDSLENKDEFNELLEVIELQAYRVQTKTCERLFPDDNTYIGSRIERLKQVRVFVFDKANTSFAETDLLNKLNEYRKVYIYEEDDESLVLKSILLELGLNNFGGYISDHDAFRIKGDKVISFEEATIGDEDIMIFTSQKKIRPFDIEYIGQKKPKNVMEIDLFD